MADIMSILRSSYTSSTLNAAPTGGKYVDVDPDAYEGTWTGKFGDNTAFKIQISNVAGYKAKVRYSSGAVNQFQEVLIKDNQLRIGDTKFILNKNGVADVRNVLTDGATGGTKLRQGYAKQNA